MIWKKRKQIYKEKIKQKLTTYTTDTLAMAPTTFDEINHISQRGLFNNKKNSWVPLEKL